MAEWERYATRARSVMGDKHMHRSEDLKKGMDVVRGERLAKGLGTDDEEAIAKEAARRLPRPSQYGDPERDLKDQGTSG